VIVASISWGAVLIGLGAILSGVGAVLTGLAALRVANRKAVEAAVEASPPDGD